MFRFAFDRHPSPADAFRAAFRTASTAGHAAHAHDHAPREVYAVDRTDATGTALPQADGEP